MDSLRKKLFIISYLGNLLLLVALFLPVLKFNNQSFSFIDQYFYLSIGIIIIITLSLILITMKKYKLSLITTTISVSIIVYGIIKIINIDGLKLMTDLSYNIITFVLFAVGFVFSIIGDLFANGNSNNEQTNISTEKGYNYEPIQNIYDNNMNSNLDINENEQIPLSQIMNNSIEDSIVTDMNFSLKDNSNINIKNHVANENSNTIENIHTNTFDNINNNFTEPDSSNNDDLINEQTTDNIDDGLSTFNNNLQENNVNENSNTIENIHTNTFDDINNNFTEPDSSNNDDLINEQTTDNIDDGLSTFNNNLQENNVNENSNIIDNDDIIMNDINEINNQPSLEKYNIKNEDLEIPDQSNDSNLMINNIQEEDKPKQEFMAINPFDIKVDEKKPLFKKKEKKEEDPIQKLMKRNIPMTLGRTCQFCNTPLGDDERICPICGRIN